MSITEIKSIKYYQNGDAYIKYKNGDIYKGQVKGKQPQGKGTFAYANGNIYEGEMVNGKFNGKGTYTVKGEYTFEADFINGEAKGDQINFEFDDGQTCTCPAINLKPEGYGIIKYKEGDAEVIYKGEIKNGLADGKGILIASNGTSFEGEFKEGLSHGKAIEKKFDQIVYDGQFWEDKYHGIGEFYDDGKLLYSGFFSEGFATNPTESKKEKKDQTILVIRQKDTNIQSTTPILSKYYNTPVVLDETKKFTSSIFQKIISYSSKIIPTKKIKILIDEHGGRDGRLGNEVGKKHIGKTLDTLCKKVKEYNKKNPFNKIKAIDISLNSCFGSKSLQGEGFLTEKLKSFVKEGIKVKVTSVDDKFEASNVITYKGRAMPIEKTNKEYYTQHIYTFNSLDDFKAKNTPLLREYKTPKDYINGNYIGKNKKSILNAISGYFIDNKKTSHQENNNTQSNGTDHFSRQFQTLATPSKIDDLDLKKEQEPKQDATQNKENASENGLSALVTASPPKGFNPESTIKRPTGTKKQKTKNGKSM